MATFLDVTSLEAFSKVFVFVLILVVGGAVFTASKVFGEAKWVGWIVSLVVAIFVILSDLLSGVVRFVTPWFAVLFIFVIFIIVASQLFGGTAADFAPYKMPLIAVVVIVFVVGAFVYIRQNVSVPGDVDQNGNVVKTANYASTSDFIFNPSILGVIFILLVAIFTVALMAGKS